MFSTMGDFPLTIGSILEYGIKVHGDSQVQTWMGEGPRTASFREVGARAKKLARALEKLGIGPGDRVGTLCWNTQEHLEAYFAVSSMGAVVHTLNPRLFPDQLAYIINHGGDRIIIVEASLMPALERIEKDLTNGGAVHRDRRCACWRCRSRYRARRCATKTCLQTSRPNTNGRPSTSAPRR